jgi:hypothetical protein
MNEQEVEVYLLKMEILNRSDSEEEEEEEE